MPSTQQVLVGVLHCQHDTYCKEFTSQCISCSDKPDKKGFYQVKLHDTILFPEGGGQPSDTGYFNETIKVHDIQRHQLEHIHYTKEPITAGSQVKMTLDWDRRFDHAQQHSGQHLLSAVLEQAPYELPTVGWCMKEKTSYVELDTVGKRLPTQDEWNQVERRLNDLILQALPITCHTRAMETTERPDSLPDDYVGGVIRTIEIEGIDTSLCCGTHVAHLGHLHAAKILHTETIRGGNTRLYFVFGQRLVSSLGEQYELSRQLNKALSVPPSQFLDSVNRLQLQLRTQTKMVKKWQAQVASYAVKDLKHQLESHDVAVVYDEADGGMPYFNILHALIKEHGLLPDDSQKAILLASGGDGQQGGGMLMVLAANDITLKKLAAKVTETLEGAKGGGARGRWTGKATSLAGIEKLADLKLE
ncbi:hypothetical protein [Absidia glauca]|uniref:Alanyl-transfer RNA synthetases family profile domain-containing protein n=1 Tax=Absidia glauca TaxID=4829 RepID=A0A168SAD3_ABSGL|nr:hypothetical protein [Absidia glauca]